MSTGFEARPYYKGTHGELSPVLTDKYALAWQHLLVAGFFAFVFLLLNHLPLPLGGLWEHANNGRWIVEHGAIPQTLPDSALADGMPYIATSWLSDVLLVVLLRSFGPEGPSAMLAINATLTMAVWFWLYHRNAGRKRFALAAIVLIACNLMLGFATPAPHIRGGLLFAILIAMCSTWENRRLEVEPMTSQRSLAVLGVMALWANLDISFFYGILFLACIAIAKVVESVHDRKSNSWYAVAADQDVQRWVLLLQFAGLATLLSPNGWRLWRSLMHRDLHGPIWSYAGGSFGLRLATVAGFMFSVLLCLWVGLLILNRARPSLSSLLMVLSFGTVTALNVRGLFWLAPIVLLFCSRLYRAATEEQFAKTETDGLPTPSEHNPLKFAWSLLCLLVIWLGFAFAPVSSPILAGKQRTADRVYESRIPREVSDWLAQHEVAGTIWAPADWTEWLRWQHGNANLFAGSAIRSFPAAVVRDYGRIFRGDGGWEGVVKNYNIRTLVIDKSRQPLLAAEVVRTNGRWNIVEESQRALLVVRNGI